MNFLNALRTVTNYTLTENGALTNKSSLDPVVDFFSLAGAMRERPQMAADLFQSAYHAEPLSAVRTLFYLRDVRGGQGERDVFRASLARLWQIDPSTAQKVMEYIPEYGRWDDIFTTPVDKIGTITPLIWNQLQADLASERPSLMAKWLPSENTSSEQTKRTARLLRTNLGYTSESYRRILSALRARIRLLEHDMSTNNWNGIDYSSIPSQAHRKHVKAFNRHTPDRYQKYLDSVTKGEAKINVNALYPYEIYNMVNTGSGWYANFTENQYANVAWENLPDFTNGEDALVMADTSASMNGLPLAVSVSLALYFAERNKGAFKGYFMTFSGSPELVKVQGDTLAKRMQNISRANWQQNTDMAKAFRAILKAALKAQEAPPKVLYVVSDMEFDRCTYGNQDTVFQTMRQEYAYAGHQLPHVVFWNVNARQTQSPATVLDGNVSLVSGCSPTVFGMAVNRKSPRELVDDVVNGERYQRITL